VLDAAFGRDLGGESRMTEPVHFDGAANLETNASMIGR
jgi:hypothetical protein